MSAGQYLKTAAAYLERAATAKKQDADNARREISEKEQALTKQVKDLERQKRMNAVDAARTQSGSSQGMEDAMDIRDISNEIGRLEQEFHQERDRLNQQISDMETIIQDLNQQAQELLAQAGNV